MSKEVAINEQIRDKEVRLISETGQQLGIVSGQEALRMADEQNLDLVKIAPKAVPPVCKIMDYGKYRFEQAKKEKEQRRNQKVITVKEVQFKPNIDEHDFNFKTNNAIKFLRGGDKVKATVRFRGREITHAQLGEELLERFVEKIAEVGTPDNKPKLEGRNMMIMVSPKTAK